MNRNLFKIGFGKFVLLAVPMFSMIGVSTVNAQFVVFNNGAEVTVNSGCIVTIQTGDLDNDSGSIDNAGRITVDGDLVNDDQITGGSASTGIFNVSGNWENNSVFTSDQSLVNLNGANQQITGSSVTTFYNLNLLGSGVKSMTLDAEVTGILSINDRELRTATNTLRVLNTSSSAVTASSGFVSSLGAGRLSWNMNSTDTYVFPLGSAAGTLRVRPLAVTPNASSANTFAARFANVDATTEGFDVGQFDPSLCFVNDQFYYQIDQVTGTDAADLTQYYVATDDGDWGNGAHWQGTPQWENMNNEVLGSVGGYSTVTNPAWSDFSQPAFALGNALPDVSIDAVSPLCEQAAPVALNATPAGGSFAGVGVSNGMFTPAFAGGGIHTISYTYTNALGCTNTAEIQIEVTDAPAVTITSSNNGALELCTGETMDLIATPGFSSYTWNPPVGSTNTITVSGSGQYSVTVEDANGCTATSVVANVTVQPIPTPVIAANGPIAFCEGETVLLSTAPNQGSYDWEITGGTNPTTVASESGDYFVTVTNQYGCVGVSNTITLDVTPMDEAVIVANGNNLTVDPPGSGYQWFLNGDPIPGATGVTYDAIQSGNYHVEYIGPNGCPTSTYVLEFTLQTGVEELSIFDVLDVYPNPGNGFINIRGQLPTIEDVTIELTNMLGQALLPSVQLNDTDSFNQSLDISQFANGVYFISVQAADSRVVVRYIKS